MLGLGEMVARLHAQHGLDLIAEPDFGPEQRVAFSHDPHEGRDGGVDISIMGVICTVVQSTTRPSAAT